MDFNLKAFAKQKGLSIKTAKIITEEAVKNVLRKQNLTIDEIKENFDQLFDNIGIEAYRLYLEYEQQYGEKVFNIFLNHLKENGELMKLEDVGPVLGKYFRTLDKFFLSIIQSRKIRAGQTNQDIQNGLFRALNYPFEEQVFINGKPDFIMPSEKHYRNNPMDCIIFTTKRTTRERWRQIVTEGTRGLGFYLSTIDPNISKSQLDEMLKHRIYVVCPQRIKDTFYNDTVNAISFKRFFRDHLDPAMERWKKNKII